MFSSQTTSLLPNRFVSHVSKEGGEQKLFLLFNIDPHFRGGRYKHLTGNGYCCEDICLLGEVSVTCGIGR